MPLAVRLAVAPFADLDDEGQVALELVVDLVVAAGRLLVLPERVGPGAVDAVDEVLVPSGSAALMMLSKSALKTSNVVSGFPREFILM